MLSDQALRDLLQERTEHLTPDVEVELDALLARATRRKVTRASAYVVVLAAAVTLAVLLAGQNWRRAEAPRPAEDRESFPVRFLVPNRGTFDSPEVLDPGRYVVSFVDEPAVEATIDVPQGWSQDDDVSLATGPAFQKATRRMDFFGSIVGTYSDPCRYRREEIGDTPLDLAQALGRLKRLDVSAPEPATLDGHPGYLLRIQVPDPLRGPVDCDEGYAKLLSTPNWPLFVQAGTTMLLWVVDVDGRRVVVDANYGPAATPAGIDELMEMVASITFPDP